LVGHRTTEETSFMTLTPVRTLTTGRIAFALVAALAAAPVKADVIDLTTRGSSGMSQGALFLQADPQPTGTGIFNPFVRIQQTGTERGYNTDARPVEFQTKDDNHWTHSLLLSSLDKVTMGTTDYYKFTLDVNEQGNTTGRLLSLNDVRVYLGDSGSLTGFNDGFGNHSRKVYDLDAAGDTTIELDYKLNSGSGSGDMFALIPVSYFQGFPNKFQYVYLYSAFGNPNQSDAGFEEWSALTGKTPPPPTTNSVPAPPSVLLAGLAMGMGFLGRLRRRTAA